MRLLLERHGDITTAPSTVLPVDDSIRKRFWTGLRARVVNFALRQLTEKLMDDGRQAVCNRLADYRITIDQNKSERERQRNTKE